MDSDQRKVEWQGEVMSLTEPLFFDTDCLSAFLWVNNQSLLPRITVI